MARTLATTTRRRALIGAGATMLGAGGARAAPDEEALGRSAGYPVGTRSNWFYDERVRVGSFSNLDAIMPHNRLPRAPAPRPLPRGEDLADLRYTFEGGARSIDDFLARQRVTGLMVVRGGAVLAERYQYDRTPAHRFVSQSMAKSITSIGVGFAVAEGRIRSVDDMASAYVPAIAGVPYGDTSIRDLLRMSSGVAFSERYDGRDDAAKFAGIQARDGTVAGLRAFTTREAPPGRRFHYASIETSTLAVVLHAATKQTLSAYIGERLWRPMGAEADATWVVDPTGTERAGGNFSATLRDWGRLAVLLADDGARDGRQIVPRDWLLEATDWRRQPAAFAPRVATPFFGYGYQFWTFPADKRRFALLGVYGQSIFVDPELRLALVITAAARNASVGKESLAGERNALWRALVGRYGKW
ncbi:MAG: serine hydrolase [Rhodospirillales bacterium]|nr:MAG: serine hydrolase [Rhodospirillales bacterium]